MRSDFAVIVFFFSVCIDKVLVQWSFVAKFAGLSGVVTPYQTSHKLIATYFYFRVKKKEKHLQYFATRCYVGEPVCIANFDSFMGGNRAQRFLLQCL